LLTPKELGKILKVSKSWVTQAAKKGIIPCHQIGPLVRFKKGDVDAYIAETRMKGSRAASRGT